MDSNTLITVEEPSDIIPEVEEGYESIEEEELEYKVDIKDYSEELLPKEERVTIPYLTKYEKCQLISCRAQQLSMGSIPLVNVGKIKDIVEIAEKELKERKMPLIVRRVLPNGKYEDWKVEELIFE